MLSTPIIITSSLLLIIFILAAPVAQALTPTHLKQDWATSSVKTAVALAFFVSLLPLFLFLNEGAESVTTS